MTIEQLGHEQTLISKKANKTAYSVDRNIVNSKVYHDKFEKLPLNKDAQQRAYIEAGRLLEFVDNLPLDETQLDKEERMSAITRIDGNLIVDNFNREGTTDKTGFNQEEYEKILEYKGDIIVMHNHSNSSPPSGKDLITYLDTEQISLSLILGHDGTIYAIEYVSVIFKEKYEELYKRYSQISSNRGEVKRLVMTRLYAINDKLPNNKKLFKVIKL